MISLYPLGSTSESDSRVWLRYHLRLGATLQPRSSFLELYQDGGALAACSGLRMIQQGAGRSRAADLGARIGRHRQGPGRRVPPGAGAYRAARSAWAAPVPQWAGAQGPDAAGHAAGDLGEGGAHAPGDEEHVQPLGLPADRLP